MANKKSVPDSVQASLSYELAVMLAGHVKHSGKYDSRADFVRAAIWDKLRDEYRTSDALDEYIDRQERLVREKRGEARSTVRELRDEAQRLNALKEERDETVEEEVDELFDQIEEADYGDKSV